MTYFSLFFTFFLISTLRTIWNYTDDPGNLYLVLLSKENAFHNKDVIMNIIQHNINIM